MTYEELMDKLKESLRYLSCDDIASIYNEMVGMDGSGLDRKVSCKESDDYGDTTFVEEA